MTTNMIALVTGANKGIGYATARQLGERGMTVLVGARDATRGRDAEGKLRGDGVDARFVSLDVTDEASCAAAAELVEREYGHLDVLVNNAGIVRADGSALPSETTVATLREVYETNVFGVVAVTNAFLPLLRNAPAARIVNVSSEVGSIAVMTDPQGALFALTSVPYPSSKTALNMTTAMYAKELRDTPIKVNAANPGYCATDFNHNSGFRTAEQGAEVSVHLATLPADGPSGQLWGFQMDAGGGYGVLPW
ncbi:SDR family oxidoreductase [Micromonospora avicenniae]|uniref:NAD(P)-dependent dehydrogenase, short-chain alcohol dehydrogenase family n=1 Tax=Micromonospora avicenniae TaxID=1198245 RepID=A0A1N6XSR4_9ACTN|nr:SDR family oxidoreductase [Micromonospora avicenniae]SIR05402.1 NAD(P)-dependent dehydrogenase, short-chain alcohol dehydrogenase family [Micromonospora avicenniae]